MNGLEQILLKIEEDNTAAAQEILKKGKAAADRYYKDIETQTEQETVEMMQKAEKQALQILENAKSGCDSLIKREELKEKSDIIKKWMETALEKAKNMDTQPYFETLLSLIKIYHHAGEGILKLGVKDLARIPDGFMDQVNAQLQNASLQLSTQPADIDSGFLMVYGGIDENCTFDALLESHTDEIKDKLFALIKA